MTKLFRLVVTELLMLLRTRELHLFGILPAVLLVPVYLSSALLVISLIPDPPLNIPVEDPGIEVDLARYAITRSDSPDGAEVAITSWVYSGGQLRTSITAPERDNDLEEALLAASLAELDARIEEAGGTLADRLPGRWTTVSKIPLDTNAALWNAALTMAVYLACFLLPTRTAEERLTGVLEAYAATATPILGVLVARWLVGIASTAFIIAIPALFLLAIAPPEIVDLGFLRASSPIEALSVHSLYIALLIAVGVAVGSTRAALGYGSLLALVAIGFALGSTFVDLSHLPLLGLGREASWGALSMRIAGPFLLAGLVLAGAAWHLRGEHVLPPGHSDE